MNMIMFLCLCYEMLVLLELEKNMHYLSRTTWCPIQCSPSLGFAKSLVRSFGTPQCVTKVSVVLENICETKEYTSQTTHNEQMFKGLYLTCNVLHCDITISGHPISDKKQVFINNDTS